MRLTSLASEFWLSSQLADHCPSLQNPFHHQRLPYCCYPVVSVTRCTDVDSVLSRARGLLCCHQDLSGRCPSLYRPFHRQNLLCCCHLVASILGCTNVEGVQLRAHRRWPSPSELIRGPFYCIQPQSCPKDDIRMMSFVRVPTFGIQERRNRECLGCTPHSIRVHN